MTKQETYDYLTAHGIEYEITEHAAVFNMEELDAIDLPYSDCDAKNLFVRDDKKVDLKAFQKTFGTRRLSFASAEDLVELIKEHGNTVHVVAL